MIDSWIAIAVGGAAGALLRGRLLRWVAKRASKESAHRLTVDPALAILIANGVGCFLLGAWIDFEASFVLAPPTWLGSLVTAGLCGGLTTFSTLCGDVMRLAKEESAWTAMGYLVATTLLGFGAFHLSAALPW